MAAGSHGTYNLSGGSLTGGLALGYGGQGDFHQSSTDGASTVVVNNNLHLGELTGSSGSYTLDGGTSSLQVAGTNKNEIIGVGGRGLSPRTREPTASKASSVWAERTQPSAQALVA